MGSKTWCTGRHARIGYGYARGLARRGDSEGGWKCRILLRTTQLQMGPTRPANHRRHRKGQLMTDEQIANLIQPDEVLREHTRQAMVAATVTRGSAFVPLNEFSDRKQLAGVLFANSAFVPSTDAHLVAHLFHPTVSNPPPPPPPPPPLPDVLGPFNTGPIVFDGGVPVGGWAEVVLHRAGTCEFRGHFHDSGTPSYSTSVVFVVRASDGHIYAFPHEGRTHGTFESGSRNDDWELSVDNGTVAEFWQGLANGFSWSAKSSVNLDWHDTLNNLVDDAKSAAEAAGVVATVIAVF